MCVCPSEENVGKGLPLMSREVTLGSLSFPLSRCQALLMKCVLPHWAPQAVSGAVDALAGTFQNG